MFLKRLLALAVALANPALAQSKDGVEDLDGSGRDLYEKDLSRCPGYVATKSWETPSGFYADLSLAGTACNVYGVDLPELSLEVEYQTNNRLHVKILDRNHTVYQVPDEVFLRPGFGQWASPQNSNLKFDFVAQPFSFSVSRADTGELLFDTTGNNLVFESQYVYLKTNLPEKPHLYGLGEHTDSFMLNTTNYTRTIYTADNFGTPLGENLYGAHPIYFDHRENGTHGVFLLNSNGMDIYIDNEGGQYLEYNIVGGVLDFYFMAGPSPREVAKQYAEIAQFPLMVPYWGLGLHQCRWGYQDVYEVAAVVANYSYNNIPLETMWTDIDYMEGRRIFTLDPKRFPPHLIKDFVDTLHARDQKYIVMVDPAVYDLESNPALDQGIEYDIFMKELNGSDYRGGTDPQNGLAWPSKVPRLVPSLRARILTEQFMQFFDGIQGPDIDALWIDMNEPANFYNRPYPGNITTPEDFAEVDGNPPEPPPVRDGPDAPITGFPDSLQPNFASGAVAKRAEPVVECSHSKPGRSRGAGRWLSGEQQWGQDGWGNPGNTWQNGKHTGSGCGPEQCRGLPNRELIRPPYMIQNAAGPTLSDSTADTDLVQSGGWVQYDTHSLYGGMMSTASYNAMRARRPDKRALVITRSTFAGSGKDVAHWLGDNLSNWEQYRASISQIMQFAALYQMPFVGADTCGFGDNTTETLCARWAMLGAFSTFYRNHAADGTLSQEFYRWPAVAQAARNAIEIRYQLMDYIYTALYKQNQTGTPALNPLFFSYPQDANTYHIDLQFFYGDGILISPVTDENSTSVTYYLPDDVFYEWHTGRPIRGRGEYVEAEVELTDITIHYKGGVIYPQRVESANTTTALRTKGFNLVVAPGLDGCAEGSLYLDDGDSYIPDAVSEIDFKYDNGKLSMDGSFEYAPGVGIETVTILGFSNEPDGWENAEYEVENSKLTLHLDLPLSGPQEVVFGC